MKILIIEDDLALSDVIAFTLRRAGFEVIPVYDGQRGLTSWQTERPDLIVLDLNLPKLDGLEICRRIRSVDQTPILILSVRSGDDVIVKGLELGADDYVVKPFSPSQLVARVRTILRRAGVRETSNAPLTIDNLTLDRSRNEVQFVGQPPIRLTPLEGRLLESLLLHPRQVLTSEQLISHVWGVDGGDRTMLKQLVYRLRSKLETTAAQAIQIEAIAGVGYTLSV